MTKEEFVNKISSVKKSPFLFLGSGFSRHYLGTPDWNGILLKFSKYAINKYKSELGTDSLPRVATEIAKENTSDFWNLPETDEFRKKYESQVNTSSAVLKIKISNYLSEVSHDINETYHEEIELLRSISIDGIITTNWDELAETIFPKFTRYIGQQELIFSPTYNIGEIYKIHGCITSPNSLILTEEDYNEFNKRNAYLAAKLITLFIEHPIVFLGYSLSDPNILELLQSIMGCLDKENVTKFQDNLIFVEWNPNDDAPFIIEKHTLMINSDIQLPITKISTHDFKKVYECLKHYQRTIPANLLREYKKQFYEIVVSEKPERQLHVLSDKHVDVNPEIQVVYGFGAIDKFQSAVGYTGLKPNDLYKDVIEETEKYNSTQILTKSIPELSKTGPSYLPVYKYLRNIGIDSDDAYKQNGLGINFKLRKEQDFQTYQSVDKSKNLKEVIDEFTGSLVWKAVVTIPWLSITDDELPTLADFINGNMNDFLVKKNRHATDFRKLVCFYDWRKYGW